MTGSDELIRHNERLLESVIHLEAKLDMAQAKQANTATLLQGMRSLIQETDAERIYTLLFSTIGQILPHHGFVLLESKEVGIMHVVAASHDNWDGLQVTVDGSLKQILLGKSLSLVDIQQFTPNWLKALRGQYHSCLLASFKLQHKSCVIAIFNNDIGAYTRNDVMLLEEFTALVEQTLTSVEHGFLKLEAQQLRADKQRAEANLIQQEKLASLGQLSAGIAHEINNPIGFVSSNLDSLKKHLKATFDYIDALEQLIPENNREKTLVDLQRQFDTEYLHDDLPELIRESRFGLDRVAKIVQSLRSYSRTCDTDWQLANICEELTLTSKMITSEFKHKCVVNSSICEAPNSYCIPTELNQVFMNLLTNAVQSMQDFGRIDITAKNVGDQLVITITDNGSGIAPEHLKKLFDPFFTTKPIGEGTGLGLSISQGIVSKHQGYFQVNSQLNRGTTFTLYFPLLSSPPAGC